VVAVAFAAGVGALAVYLLRDDAGDDASAATTVATATTAAPSTSAGGFHPGQGAACATDLKTMQVVVESWRAMHGDTEVPTEAQLVDEGLLRAEMPTYDIDARGEIVPAPGAPCG
jgi:hypothetical protein